MIPRNEIELVKEKAHIVNVLEKRYDVMLTGRQNALKAVCPLPGHDERTPSFVVYSDEGRFHCYGCGEYGDVFALVQKMEGSDFRSAVVSLAEWANVPLSEEEEQGTSHATLRDVCARASELFCNETHPELTAFIKERKFDEAELREKWRVGYSAPRVFTQLQKEFPLDLLVEAGLMRQGEGRPYPFFPPRMMWPITDNLGRVVGFSARTLHEGDPLPGKFVNSPATSIYKKAKVLFGLDHARRNIRKERVALVCEGQMDVVAFHDCQVPYAVAPCGTAFTEDHAKTLATMVGPGGEVVVSMDNDAAGRKASIAILSLLTKYDLVLTAIDGLDEDPEMSRRLHGRRALKEAFDNRVPLVQALLSPLIDGHADPELLARNAHEARHILENIHDTQLRLSYTRWAEARFGLSLDVSYTHLVEKPQPTYTPLELDVIRLAYLHPQVYREWEDKFPEELFSSPRVREALEAVSWLDPHSPDGQWREDLLKDIPEDIRPYVSHGLPDAAQTEDGAREYIRELHHALTKKQPRPTPVLDAKTLLLGLKK